MQFVYAAQDYILQRIVALKTPKNSSAEKRFHRSAIVAARVNHPNVAKTLDYFEADGRAYLIEEFIDGSDLDKALLKRAICIDPYLAARVFHYLAKGLAASHHAGVVHRDLKPTNVMVAGDFQLDAVKITDFGIAKMAEEELVEAAEGGDATITNSQTAVGALPYMAPEAIETPRDVGTPADVWSVGAMMFELIAGEKPFGSGFKAIKKIMDAQQPNFPPFLTSNAQFSALSSNIMDIIVKCLKKNPLERPTADTLVEDCGKLCYPTVPRCVGLVREIRHKAWGFIQVVKQDVFFHMKSVYGERPSIGDAVMLSKFPGGGAWRAHPVVKLKKDSH
jgi:serine/threonine-protein kinase